MKQGFLILNHGWGKGPTSCRGNDYKWSLQLKCLLLQQLPFWFAWFSPSQSIATENTLRCHLTLQFSLVSCIKLKFLALAFEAVCVLATKQLAFVLVLLLASWGLFAGTPYLWMGFHFMPDDNYWIPFLGPFIVSFLEEGNLKKES